MCGFMAIFGDSIDQELFASSFAKIKHRGPDQSLIENFPGFSFAFHRLAIMDTSSNGMQPFKTPNTILVCNGEIYNWKSIRSQLPQHSLHSNSDCEVIVGSYEELNLRGLSQKNINEKLKAFTQTLDGEFAFVIFDKRRGEIFAARDPLGIRPMFYGKGKNKEIFFASELKALQDIAMDIKQFPPGYFFSGQDFFPYFLPETVQRHYPKSSEEVDNKIRSLLSSAVTKRLDADVPIAFLLSGGLDSSLVCAIAQSKSKKPIKTFAVGMDKDPIDLKYAKQVAQYIGSEHVEVIMRKEDIFSNLHKIIEILETWDITTIRASIGMYIVCKHIREHSNIKVLVSGEISDELFGYKYTDFAPSADAFQKESEKRIREVHMYDALRADRCIAAHGLEARVPFSDLNFVSYVLGLDPERKINTTGIGKYLLRSAFREENLLPYEILWRDKAAFSDAVGHSMVDYLKEYAEKEFFDEDFKNACKKYPYRSPISKEALLYRSIFEKFYPQRAETVIDYWLPNQDWSNCNVKDPSARVLPNYGKSGI